MRLIMVELHHWNIQHKHSFIHAPIAASFSSVQWVLDSLFSAVGLFFLDCSAEFFFFFFFFMHANIFWWWNVLLRPHLPCKVCHTFCFWDDLYTLNYLGYLYFEYFYLCYKAKSLAKNASSRKFASLLL